MSKYIFQSLSDYIKQQREEKRIGIPQTAQLSIIQSNKANSPRQRGPLGHDIQRTPPTEQKDYSLFNSMQAFAANSAQNSRDIYDSFDPMNFDLSFSVSKPYGSKSDCGKASFCDRGSSTALPNLFADGGPKTRYTAKGRTLAYSTVPATGEVRRIDFSDSKDFDGVTGYRFYDNAGNKMHYTRWQDTADCLGTEEATGYVLPEVEVLGKDLAMRRHRHLDDPLLGGELKNNQYTTMPTQSQLDDYADARDSVYDLTPYVANFMTLGYASQAGNGWNTLLDENSSWRQKASGVADVLSPLMFVSPWARAYYGLTHLADENGVQKTWDRFSNGDYVGGAKSAAGDFLNLMLAGEGGYNSANNLLNFAASQGNKTAQGIQLSRAINGDVRTTRFNVEEPLSTRQNAPIYKGNTRTVGKSTARVDTHIEQPATISWGEGKKIVPFKSELDWSPESWFEKASGRNYNDGTPNQYTDYDIDRLNSHIPEYLEIEKQAKVNDTWLKMPDGSIWPGDPREWVQYMSDAVQKHNPEVFWTGIKSPSINPNYSGQLWGVYGQGKLSAAKARTYATNDDHVLPMFSKKDAPATEYDANMNSWFDINGKMTNDIVNEDFSKGIQSVKKKRVSDTGSNIVRPGNSRYSFGDALTDYDIVNNSGVVQNDIILAPGSFRKSLRGNNGDYVDPTHIYRALFPLMIGGTTIGVPLFNIYNREHFNTNI